MRHSGRRRRSEENPDTDFGKELKKLRLTADLAQGELARESFIAPETLSRMVKGQREPTRDNVRAIIKALHARKVLLTLDKANALMLTIPKMGVLDKRDDEDREIIDLFDSPETEIEPEVSQGDDSVAVDTIASVDDDIVPYEYISFDTLDTLDEDEVIAPDIVPVIHTAPAIKPIQGGNEVAASDGVLEPPITLFPTQSAIPDPVSEPPVTSLPTSSAAPDTVPEPPIALPVTPVPVPAHPEPLVRGTRRYLWWYIGSGLTFLVIIGLILGATHQNQALPQQRFAKQLPLPGCSAPTGGVTLYTDINYKGQCHTFQPGDYELARYGLEQNVSSIRDWNDAYFVKILDTGKNFYNLDKSMAALPADWDNRADMLHIEKHRPTSCTPGTNGIIAYLNANYANGCLFITKDIPDLTKYNFDGIIISIRFVGTYRNTMQLVIYSQPNYQGRCGAYWENQTDLGQCARLALSVRVLPFTPPTPI